MSGDETERADEAAGSPDDTQRRPWIASIIVLWLALVCLGLGALFNYYGTSGADAHAPEQWPADSSISRSLTRATLVMMAHPDCSSTRASVAELARLMADVDGRVEGHVLFLKPPGLADGWEQTDLWSTAEAIPDVTVHRDDAGIEAQRFHGQTSGQVVLYGRDGRLLFQGGVTNVRAHEGPDVGSPAIVAIRENREVEHRDTFVSGCPLFADAKLARGEI